MKIKTSTSGSLTVVLIGIYLALIIGWVRCCYKFTQCDFKGPYKAELIYGVGIFSGLGCVVGWFDIKSN